MLPESIETQNALNKLNELKQSKVTLSLPVFFVPGWTDESCYWWKKSDAIPNTMEGWLDNIATNSKTAYFVDFTSVKNKCMSFLDFGEALKKYIWSTIGKNQPFDLVGHSMGGLDIRAAITQGDPLINCRCCIGVATPQQGDNFGGMANTLAKWFPALAKDKWKSYQIAQMKNLDPNYPPIKLLNTLDNRIAFFQRIKKFYEMKGLRDFVVKGSAFMDKTGIETLYQNKAEDIPVDGCEHTGPLGITQDARVILAILYILCEFELDLEGGNCGIFAGGVDRPADNSNVFI